MTAEQVALDHYRSRRVLVDAAADVAEEAWRQVDPDRIAASWAARIPELTVAVSGAQRAAAQAADSYVESVLDEQGLDPAGVGRVNPRALSGVASDGRDLASLLRQPAITALVGIQGGAPVREAMAAGRANLDMIVRTQVADAGRVADGVATMARPAATGYVRMVVGKTCARCIILAGRVYAVNAGFQRHPRCDCIHVPAASGLRTNPRAVFDDMTTAEQDEVFGKAAAQAIRDGADMARVVNARRGMYTAGGRRLTREATRRGTVRRMPEQIYADARGDREAALRMLREDGYLIGRPVVRAPRPVTARPVAQPAIAPPTLADRVAGGVLDRRRLGGGVMADTELVTLNDGTRAVFKRAKDSSGELAVVQQDAEELGALVARAVGLRAPEIARVSSDELYMSFLDGEVFDELDDAARQALLASDEGARLGLADLLMGNTDRNGGNLLVQDGRIGAIDHGMAFQWDAEFNPPSSPPQFRDDWWHRFGDNDNWSSNPLSQADVQTLRRRLGDLRPEFQRLGRLDWHDAMMTRLGALAEHANGRGIIR